MYVFLIFLAFCLIVVPIFLYSEIKKRKKLEQEKAEGKWDFILEEYIPYLQSYPEPIIKIEKLEFKISYRSKMWLLSGDLNYNAAGVFIKLTDIGTGIQNAPSEIFIWGKEKPSKFKPAVQLFFHSSEAKKDDFILRLKTREDSLESNYMVAIKNAPLELAVSLNKIFGYPS